MLRRIETAYRWAGENRDGPALFLGEMHLLGSALDFQCCSFHFVQNLNI